MKPVNSTPILLGGLLLSTALFAYADPGQTTVATDMKSSPIGVQALALSGAERPNDEQGALDARQPVAGRASCADRDTARCLVSGQDLTR